MLFWPEIEFPVAQKPVSTWINQVAGDFRFMHNKTTIRRGAESQCVTRSVTTTLRTETQKILSAERQVYGTPAAPSAGFASAIP
jgi:hypothetical protein